MGSTQQRQVRVFVEGFAATQQRMARLYPGRVATDWAGILARMDEGIASDHDWHTVKTELANTRSSLAQNLAGLVR